MEAHIWHFVSESVIYTSFVRVWVCPVVIKVEKKRSHLHAFAHVIAQPGVALLTPFIEPNPFIFWAFLTHSVPGLL